MYTLDINLFLYCYTAYTAHTVFMLVCRLQIKAEIASVCFSHLVKSTTVTPLPLITTARGAAKRPLHSVLIRATSAHTVERASRNSGANATVDVDATAPQRRWLSSLHHHHHFSTAASMADAIDLTFSSDEDDAAGAAAAAAAAAGPMPAGGTAAASEDDQRKRIMSFAAGVAASKRRAAPSPPKSSEDPAAAAATAASGAAATAPAAAAAAAAAANPGPGGNSLLAQLHAERLARQQQAHGGSSSDRGGGGGGAGAGSSAAVTDAAAGPSSQRQQQQQQPRVTLLQYNVWFNEDAAVEARMAAIGRIIEAAGRPTFIALQEVTPTIQALLAAAPWWRAYAASPPPSDDAAYYTLLLARRDAVGPPAVTEASFRRQPFANSVMGRCLLTLLARVGGRAIAVATSHLESPCPPDGLFTKQRQHQMRDALRVLDAAPAANVLFAGDMNWVDARDGAPPLGPGWRDCWLEAAPGGAPGFTYDTSANPMLTGRWPGSRLDRVFAKLGDWRVAAMRLVGTEPIAGATYHKPLPRGRGGTRPLPVLPSDHFGLLLELEPADGGNGQ